MPDGSTADDVEIPLYLQLLWRGEDDTSRPGPKRGVDLPTIADAGVRIADSEGLSAVSMRRLAAEVGFTTMALYRYVQSKSEVMALLMDQAYGPPAPLAAASDWRSQLAAWATANRDAISRHPWILDIRITEPPLGPHQIGWMELGLTAMADTVLTEQDKLSALLLVDVYVRGQSQLSLQLTDRDSGAVDTGELWARRLLHLITAERMPNLRAALLSGALADEGDDFATDEFAFGLDSVLDGIQARIDRRLSRSPQH
jgi:AcrR family transcriptional regulator